MKIDAKGNQFWEMGFLSDAVLTTLPLNILYQFGVCVAVGILLNTFIVRGLLVPGLVLILGKWN